MLYRDNVTGRFITKEQWEDQQDETLEIFTSGIVTIGIATALLLPNRNTAELIRRVNESISSTAT